MEIIAEVIPRQRWLEPRTYDSVISIGSQCLTASLLKAADLRLYSGPFDWIFSNLRMVCDCIEDDFATFLDPTHFQQIPLEARLTAHTDKANHAVYRDRYRLQSIFNHRDPTEPAVLAYLERCVGRFRSALLSGRPHLLLAISRRSQGGSYAFNRLCDLLEPSRNIEVCVLIAREPGANRAIELWEQRDHHRLLNLNLTSTTKTGLEFEAPEDTRFVIGALQRLIRLKS